MTQYQQQCTILIYSRLKKEKRSFIVKRCVEERRKLDDGHKMKLESEGKKIEDIKKKFAIQVAR
jgi:hypothetical protein